jgi:hypothetical protein
MNKQLISRFLATVFVATLTACGGGGGDSSAPTTAAVKLSTVAKAGENPQIKALSVTLQLPAGVTLKTVGSTQQTADGVVRYSSGTTAFSNLTSQLFPRPPVGSYAGGTNIVTVTVFSATTAFGAGEFATINCDVAGGKTVTENGFQIVAFEAYADGFLQGNLTGMFDLPQVALVK